ncbi:glycosyl transferase family 2 [Paenibacillus alkaliterrae]|uniref:glycosylhydrolase-like jelly roll fold domain-containing protein n=1 Tax=Paenibacillus alkaliterrae TaxID=320909 RepID=UPI001F2D4D40|nr:glycosylhydrolase-like jelly roll fold domain-containing protein [Paenibacillus alkaliterrae]MCF2939187.1 glycosyl transferase family 2 [Paenibacillus alkaliterrae]
MNIRIEEVLEGKEANYIFPLFWQHGEDESVLREEMARIYESGIRAVCVEARPHSDYLGPKWWQDMDAIMEEARQRGMRVWVLDDDHFPTGRAAGRLKDAPDELRRLFLHENHIDAVGPMKNGSFFVDVPDSPFAPALSKGGNILGVIAARRDSRNGELTGEMIDLTSRVDNGILRWDIPEGYWRIFILIETGLGGSAGQDDYINPLVAESVRVLIDTVYEAFYERYRNDFGHTLAGFFSDEPGFYNDKDTFDFNSKPGKKRVVLPWSRELPGLLKQALGSDYRLYLPLLWHEGGNQTAVARFTFMTIVSKLYAERFTNQIGDWCRERRIEYIGHVLEDNNVHARLGSGAGHFFRALWGQDMSGLDVVLWQIVPGFDEVPFTWVAGETDSEFFHYGLAKMAVSLGHIDPKKKGRTMAEVFGAYGWAEGLKLMKWLTDHMLVRGVNHFVPHAFSAKEFPDPDCPPHMYARGKNPQYRYYRELNLYTNRISHLLSGGLHIATAAVLYHAEAEWSGSYMYFHKPVKELMRSQIDCDVLPADTLTESVSVESGKLRVQEETFDCLIVPYSEALPSKLLNRLAELAEHGLLIVFVDGLPVRSSEGDEVGEALGRLDAHVSIKVVPLGNLAEFLKEKGLQDIRVKGEQPYLRHYHVEYSDLGVHMFTNEHPFQSIATEVVLPVKGRVLLYDAFRNVLSESGGVESGDGTSMSLRLSPYESVIVLTGTGMLDIPASKRSEESMNETVIEGPWTIATATSEQYPSFETWGEAEGLSDMSLPGKLPTFSGTFRYEMNFDWMQQADRVFLDLGEVFETAEVRVNGQSAGICICPPYRLDIGDFVHTGTNTLTIEVTNTLVKEQRDFLSHISQQESSGLLGPVRLWRGEN